MKPERSFRVAAIEALRKGWYAAYANLRSIIALQVAMAAIVAIYYLWPAGSAVLSAYARLQGSGGPFGTGLVYALAGGVLSELSYVYFQQKGRWNRENVENLGFKFIIFFISGSVVYEFYRYQAIWWGTGAGLRVIIPKIIVDQFGYTVVFAAPYFALLTRWQALRYSGGETVERDPQRHLLHRTRAARAGHELDVLDSRRQLHLRHALCPAAAAGRLRHGHLGPARQCHRQPGARASLEVPARGCRPRRRSAMVAVPTK